MSSKSVCQVASSWVHRGSFHTRLFGVVYFPIASVQEFLDTPSYQTQMYTTAEDYCYQFQNLLSQIVEITNSMHWL
jgi:hypothetical protein